MASKKPKFYVVWEGHEIGIYTSWEDCKKYVSNYPNAKYKSFPSLEDAKIALNEGFYAHLKKSKKKEYEKTKTSSAAVDFNSIAVDAASSGNPGRMEYRGVVTATKKVLFHQGPFPEGTSNIGEFLALVHGLAFLKQQNSNLLLYSDSKIAMGWVKKKKCNTKLKPNKRNEALFKLIERAEIWLHNNTYTTQICKWETKQWGEIPADFGRK